MSCFSFPSASRLFYSECLCVGSDFHCSRVCWVNFPLTAPCCMSRTHSESSLLIPANTEKSAFSQSRCQSKRIRWAQLLLERGPWITTLAAVASFFPLNIVNWKLSIGSIESDSGTWARSKIREDKSSERENCANFELHCAWADSIVIPMKISQTKADTSWWKSRNKTTKAKNTAKENFPSRVVRKEFL